MEKFILLAFACVLASSLCNGASIATKDRKIPPITDVKLCEKEGHFRNPYDCMRFYRCHVDETGQMRIYDYSKYPCRAGMVFDEKEEVCMPESQSPPCNNKPLPGEDAGAAKQNAVEKKEDKKDAKKITVEKSKDEKEAKKIALEKRKAEREAKKIALEKRKVEREANRIALEKRKAEKEAKKKALEEAKRLKEEKKAKEEERQKEAIRKAEEEAFRLAQEKEAKRKEEEDARIKAVEDAKRKSEEEAFKKAQDERLKREEEARKGGKDIINQQIPPITDVKLCVKEGHFRNPYDCMRFYRCHVDETGQMRIYDYSKYPCSAGMVFDEKEEVCMPESQSPPCNNKPLP